MRLLRHLCAALSFAILLFPGGASAADLKPATRQAFNHYSELAESRLSPTRKDSGPFLWIDQISPERRQQAMAQLEKGEVVIERMQEKENGQEIKVPDGLVHDWLGIVFVPDMDVAQAVAMLQDYDHHKDVYKSDVVDSRLISRHGDDFQAYMRFYKKKIIGVTLDTFHAAHYGMLGPARAYSLSRSTRVNEVEDAGTAKEKELPEGDGHGFLWALNSFWRLEQKDGGVYIQCRAITLSRDIPMGLGWLIKPMVTEVPRESLLATLSSTRTALMRRSVKKIQKGK